jgi:nicotinamide-nucleotide adenylyltransferase
VKGLFVGRFQPFHLGHLKALKWVLERCEKVTVVVGSSQESFTKRNPFTYEERKRMIKKSLEDEGVAEESYDVIGTQDVFDCERWVKSIMEKSKFDVVFTTSSWVKQCFDLSRISVEEHPMFRRYSGRKVRKMMEEDEDWKNLVPNGSLEIIKKINVEERLKDSSLKKTGE